MEVKNFEVANCSFLNTHNKENCFGCEACVQVCPKNAIKMVEDNEGFRYPKIDKDKCVNCGLCHKTCPYTNMPKRYKDDKYTFGGYHNNWDIRSKSTSGGAFSAIVESYCDKNYVIFGAATDGLKVHHTYIKDVKDIDIFRKSKYIQSEMGNSYQQVKKFLNEGKKIIFSGTPCQIAGLRTYLKDTNISNLLTVEVICEGVPSPHYVKKYTEYLSKKYNSKVKEIDYRYTNPYKIFKKKHGKWDFQVMRIMFEDGRIIKKDRWLNPFWNIWLNHLMSRPSCYNCQFTDTSRVADITLGDLWGIHLFCPELYGNNGGASLIICNTDKGKDIFNKAKKNLYGHELDFNTAIKYQSPLRKPIDKNARREEFIMDLTNSNFDYKKLCKKWYKKPTLKFMLQKYFYGNRQKIFLWNLKNGGKK